MVLVVSSCSRQEDNATADQSPGVKRVGDRAVVFGCDGELDWNAKGACPWIRCEAAILNSGEVDLLDEVKLWGGPVSDDGARQLVVGTAGSLRPSAPTRKYVHCLIEADKVARVGVITERQYNAVRYNNEWL
jgi:hypothetical protein